MENLFKSGGGDSLVNFGDPGLKAVFEKSRALEQTIWSEIWDVLKLLLERSKNPNCEQKLDNNAYMKLQTNVYNYVLATDIPLEVRADDRIEYLKFEQQTRAKFLNEKMSSFFNAYLAICRRNLIEKGASNEAILRWYCKVFEGFCETCEIINNICCGNKAEGLGLDHKLLNFLAIGYLSWKNLLLEPFQNQVVHSLMDLIDRIRKDPLTSKDDENMLQIVSKSMLTIDNFHPGYDLHENLLESELLARASNFYSEEYKTLSSLDDTSRLIKKLAERLIEEEVRAQKFIPSLTRKMVDRCEQVLIVDRIDDLMKEFKSFLQLDSTDDLKNLFNLVSRTGPEKVAIIHREFYEYVLSEGRQAIHRGVDFHPSKNPVLKFIEISLDYLHKFEHIVAEAFKNDNNFAKMLNDALKGFFEENKLSRTSVDLPSSFLALYFDNEMKKFDGEHEEAKKLWNKLRPLVSVVTNLDSFIYVYETKLASRLINNLGKPIDPETDMIHFLGTIIGKGDREIKKCEIMVQDILSSIDFSRELNNNNNLKKKLGFNVEGHILKSSSWPYTQRENSFLVPEPIGKANDEISNHYKSTHNGRAINWLHSVSFGELNWILNGKKISFKASSYQIAILMAFNGKKKSDQITIDDMLVLTGIPRDIFDQVVQPLEAAKIMCPIMSRGGIKIAYRINGDYKRKLGKNSRTVNLIKPIKSEEKSEEERGRKTLASSRNFAIQCGIVRILKTQKTILKRELMNELGKQNLHFSFTARDVEKELKELRERSFCERNINDQEEETGDTLYTYIA